MLVPFERDADQAAAGRCGAQELESCNQVDRPPRPVAIDARRPGARRGTGRGARGDRPRRVRRRRGQASWCSRSPARRTCRRRPSSTRSSSSRTCSTSSRTSRSSRSPTTTSSRRCARSSTTSPTGNLGYLDEALFEGLARARPRGARSAAAASVADATPSERRTTTPPTPTPTTRPRTRTRSRRTATTSRSGSTTTYAPGWEGSSWLDE